VSPSLDFPALTLAFAMFAGVLAQLAAHHARVPGIVLLLTTGVVLGPDVANVIRPSLLGSALGVFVGFAVAVVLFEGGLNLRIPVLQQQAKPIRRLVTIGAIVTAILAAVAARFVMDWDWRLSILFGTLVIVTGPTVVTPLVRRLRLQPHLASILVAEGIFIDAVGATIAVVALEIALAGSDSEVAYGGLSIFLRFGVGGLTGLAGGAVLITLFRLRNVVPHGMENILAFAVAVATFHASDALTPESGITAAIVAGLVVGNVGFGRLAEVAEFKEQLTDLVVATLFVLLAADVRVADVVALGWQGVALLAILALVVRPACVLASTRGSGLTWRETLYLSWLAPRGIVAAAVASLFAVDLAEAHIAGGTEMRAMVFLVIAGTVTLQGLSAGPMAGWLGVRLPARVGFLVLGANALGRLVAARLTRLGVKVLVIDSSAEACAAAREEGLSVIETDALSPAKLVDAGIFSTRYALGITPNEHVNYLFARRIAHDLRGPSLAVALERDHRGVTAEMVERDDIEVLFAGETDLHTWLARARHGDLRVESWQLGGGGRAVGFDQGPLDVLLPIALTRGSEVLPVVRRTELRTNDTVAIAVHVARADEAASWLESHGWTRVDGASARAKTV